MHACVPRTIAIFCGLSLALLASGVSAVNLLVNPGFDTDLSGWTVLFGRTASRSTLDAGNNPGSGSALVVNELNPSNGATPLVLAQCLAAFPSTIYSFGGLLRVPAGQPDFTSAQIIVHTYASGNCSGNALQTESESTDSVSGWESESKTFTTFPGVQSIFFALGVFKPTGVAVNASGLFDNLFLQQGAAGFAIGPAMSGSWYNAAESGHGIMLDLIDPGHAWMCWFAFDLDGNRAWICALGNISGDTIVFASAFMVDGGKFPPLFNPAAVTSVAWGSITVTFTGCNSGTMQWTTSAPHFQSGSMPLSRVTSLWGLSC
jgi:hypothetical protein